MISADPGRFAVIALFCCLAGCAPVPKPGPVAVAPVIPATPVQSDAAMPVDTDAAKPVYKPVGPPVTGTASWYKRSAALQKTCSGQPLRNNALTAASPTLPVGTTVRVTHLSDNQSAIVRINDCMPHEGRVIDLSEGAARKVGLTKTDIGKVSVTPVKISNSP